MLFDFLKRPRPEAESAPTQFRADSALEAPVLFFVEQLDPSDPQQVVQTFPVCEIPYDGVTISRPNAQKGTIKLSGQVQCAFTVSQEHIRIGKDDQGLFLQDMRMDGRVLHNEAPVTDVDITDGLVLILGDQPLRFRVPGRQHRRGQTTPVSPKTTIRPAQPPTLFVEKLDSRTGAVLGRAALGEIPSYALRLELDGPENDDFWVGQDGVGLYLSDGKKARRIHLGGSATDEIAISDGLVVTAGTQCLRFTLPKAAPVPTDAKTRVYEHATRIVPDKKD